MRYFIKKILCKIFGHDYKFRGYSYNQTKIYQCSRCGKKALGSEAFGNLTFYENVR